MASELILIDAPDQEFTTLISGQRCRFRFRYNVLTDRWSFDLDIRGEPALRGVRVVLDSDLLRGFDLGIGKLAAFDYEGRGNQPDRTALPERRVRIYHVTPEEIAAYEAEQAAA